MANIQTPQNRPRHLGRWITAGATLAVVGVVVSLAAVWPGFDAQQTPLDDGSVWALQTGDGRRYAKVNTQLHELETVKQVENPSGIAQSSSGLFVYADGDTKVAPVSLATPVDLGADTADAFQSTPSGTNTVANTGDYLAYLTDAGDVYAGTMSAGGSTVPIDPYADVKVDEGQERPRLRASAVAVSASGVVYAVSLANGRVFTADARTGKVLSEKTFDAGDSEKVQITAVGDTWAVLDADKGRLWTGRRDGSVAVQVEAGAQLQHPGTARDAVYIADRTGLVAAALDGSGQQRTVDAAGAAAAPTEVAGTLYAAWLGADSGVLWSSDTGTSDLAYGSASLGDQVTPAFAVKGSRAILNETSSGWVWTVPDGRLVTSSQQWTSDERSQQRKDQQQEAQRVIDPKPPVAVPDAFGVRAGRDVVLPVLLNDHDPNEDVLTVVPSSVTGLDPGFGTVRTTNQDQQLVVNVAAGATGSASFTYRITDGTTADGMLSEPATVTLTVVPENVNNPPVWCGVQGCLATWPNPQVLPGGTTSVDVLGGWVDPDGDPIYLASAVNQTGVGTVAADPNGTVTYQHPDANATDALSVQIALTVSDSRGATADRALNIAVTPSPQLTADSFALTGNAGTPLTVALGSHLHNANGALSLSSAKALNESAATVVPNSAALSFVFSAAQPGSYIVQYSVRDKGAEASGIVRVTMLDPALAQISTPPLTAFVRPNEDASVDVVAAVNNPAGAVLLVSDLRPEPLANASLSVDTVGQNLIRVSGATDSGQPGTLGTVRYTVSDGSGSPLATTTGELTVVLLPTPSAESPIAVDDTVTVRAGAQIDIPVLTNDTAPAGALIAVDPSKIVNESNAGLAFATPSLVRYLAPTAAGTYSLSYTIYRLGFPELTDTARVFITVLSNDTNSAPVPKDLVGRVLSGSSVSIPFDGYATDPDGDAVTLDRVVSQPSKGSASISADGTSMTYTSAPNSSGQDSFTYRVRDPLGATGTATVRIGILDAKSDPSPVTYSDYAQAQMGDTNEVVVHPADNDVDPAGSKLDLIEVRPNAQSGTPEYDALEAMLTKVNTDDGSVRLRSGTQLGTFSFIYTVRNRTGDTAQGLIVLKVVRSAVPDYPVVTDTSLTAESRDKLTGGVDVVAGKVSWTGGDVSSLKLSLWGDAAGMSVSGSRISGPLPKKALVVPFQLTGTSFSGAEVTSYGFLRIPGDDDIKLTLRSSFAEVQVNEKASVDVDMAQAVAVPAGKTLQVGTTGLAASGARSQAACTLTSGTTVRYDAGAGAPWNDVCTVPVKLDTQEDYTYLAVRITIIAEAPQPLLRAASLSVSPGAQATYDLTSMTTWQGQNDWSKLQYAETYTGDQFTVVQQGSQLTVTAKDASRPGREEPVVVKLTSHPDSAAATLMLTVGPAPSTLPKGGTAAQQCSQSGGNTSCTIQVIGGGGEVNPLPGTPLVLVSVNGPANCRGVTFAKASDSAVTASWAADAPGAGDCTGSFVVQDAQGRQSSGDRNGTIILDLQGLPADPSSVTWTGYSDSTVSLSVTSTSTSYPTITGYKLTGSNGATANCSAQGVCEPIASSPALGGNGVTYQAKAVNSVGESRAAKSVMAWSYRAPAAPSSVTSVPTGDRTAKLSVTLSDDSTGSVALRIGSQTVATQNSSGAGTLEFDGVNVGTNTDPARVTAVPSTKYTVPPPSVATGSSEGQTKETEAWGIGAPSVSLSVEPSKTGSTGSVDLVATVSSSNGHNATLKLGFGTSKDSCTPSDSVGLETGDLKKTLSGLEIWKTYTYVACGVYVYNGTTFDVGFSSEQSGEPTGDVKAPNAESKTYSISLPATGMTRAAKIDSRPSVSPTSNRFTVKYLASNGASSDSFDDLFAMGKNPGAITAVQCAVNETDRCTPAASAVKITPANGSAPYLAKVVFGQCDTATGTVPAPTVTAESGDHASPTVDETTKTASVTFTNNLEAFGTVTQSYPSCIAPVAPGTGTGGGTGTGTGGGTGTGTGTNG